MEEKITAIYVMVRQDELTPEDQGSYEAPLARQEELCLRFLREQTGDEAAEPVEVYTNQTQLLLDIDRNRVKRLVVESLGRLGANRESIEGLKYELGAAGVELMVVNP